MFKWCLFNHTNIKRDMNIDKIFTNVSFSFSFSSRCHSSVRKGPYSLRPVSQESPQGCPGNSANICLVEHRSFSTSEGGLSAASFLHSSFLRAINAVMLWPVHVQEVPQASEYICPAKLQTRCDICGAYQSVCLFIPTDVSRQKQNRTMSYFEINGCGFNPPVSKDISSVKKAFSKLLFGFDFSSVVSVFHTPDPWV